MNSNLYKQLADMYSLKSVYRDTLVEDRPESTAEHTWSMFFLADYFLETYKYKLDRAKIYQMITYHDLTEVKIGDVPLKDHHKISNKQELEHKALSEIKENLPNPFSDYVYKIITEYEDRKTEEAKFVKAVDFIDNELTCLCYRYPYKTGGYSRKFLEEKFDEKTESYIEMKQFFFELLDVLENEGQFDL